MSELNINQGGLKYNLENAPFAQGGEGKVYNIVGEPKKVAKLYKNGLNDLQKERKLLVMVNNPPSKSVMSQIAWPLDVLYDSSNTFVGFVMPKLAINEDLNVIYEYGSASKYPNVPWSNKIIIAKNLCAVLDAVHEAGHVVGDLNPKNISVDPSNGHIIFVDTDSYHIEDNGAVYRCNVGMPEYLPVEIQRKMKGGLSAAPLPTFSKATDNFALAVHIFQLLMNGTHPFACRVLPSQSSVVFPQPTDNILNGVFPFMQPKSGIALPVYAPPITILPKEMQDLFRKAFIDGHTNPNQRPTPEDWYTALTNLERELAHCSKVTHHEYYKGVNACPWCEADNKFNQGVVSAKKTPMVQSTIKQSMQSAYVPPPRTYSQPRSSSYSNTGSSSQSGYAGTYVGGYSGWGYSSTRSHNKKKLIIIISIIAAIVLALIIGLSVGLSNRDNGVKTIQLSTPSSVRVANGEVAWDSVKDASSYVVLVNDNEIPVSRNSFRLDSSYEPGTYTISVKARGSTENVIESAYSTTISVIKPKATKNASISNGVLSWDTVDGFNSYKIQVNGAIVDTMTMSLSFALTGCFGSGGSGGSSDGTGKEPSITYTSISTASELQAIANQGGNYKLANNIDISGSSWSPIAGFTGLLEGDNYEIQGLTISGNNANSGLFSTLKGTVQNLKITSVNITGTGDAGTAGAICGTNEGTIKNVTASGTITAPYYENVGGIAGKSSATLTSCVNNITVSGYDNVGGIVGKIEGISTTAFSANTNNANISGNANVGGVLGVVAISNTGWSSWTISITNNTNTGAVSGSDNNVGGIGGSIVGNAPSSYTHAISLSSNSNSGVINGKDNTGGIIGYGSYVTEITASTNSADISGNNYVGGYIGRSDNTTIKIATNNNTITGRGYVGGIAGYAGAIDNCTNNGRVNSTAVIVESSDSCAYVGGVAGYAVSATKCTNNTDITVSHAVECCVVQGQAKSAQIMGNENHSWNKVKIDSKWLNVDVTFDLTMSLRGYIRHDYLFLSDDAIKGTHFQSRGEEFICNTNQLNYFSANNLVMANQQQLVDYVKQSIGMRKYFIEIKLPATRDVGTVEQRVINSVRRALAELNVQKHINVGINKELLVFSIELL